jgi:hypothetical protein
MKSQSTAITTAAFLVLSLLASAPRSALAGTTTFSNGQTDEWQFSGAANIVPDGGNPGAYMAFQAIDVFGINVFNDSNSEFTGSVYQSPVTISIDVQTNSITFMGNEVSRDLFVELSDTSPNQEGYPGTSLFYDLGPMSSFTPGWIHYSVTITDPNSTVLPPGWSGTGAEDADGNPILPPGQTFASVLQNVDAINFTTYEPGFTYGHTNFDLSFDNLGVNAVPEPSSLTLLGIAVLALAGIAWQKVPTRASGFDATGIDTETLFVVGSELAFATDDIRAWEGPMRLQGIEQVLQQHFVKEKVRGVFGSNETELITRHAEDGTGPTSFLVKLKDERGLDIERLIVLPSGGFTANMPNWMNSHAEAHHATIEILGGVREGRIGFSKLKHCLEFAHAANANSSEALNVPYKETTIDGVQKPLLSSGSRAHVVKEDGFGFYHNLTNKADDWLVIKLEKHLRLTQGVDLAKFANGNNGDSMALASDFYRAVQTHGDEVFHAQPELVSRVANYRDAHQIVPPLIEMLKVYDAGRHEACTIFAILLRIGKKHPEVFHEYAAQALAENFEPAFYLKQLMQKINRANCVQQGTDGAT